MMVRRRRTIHNNNDGEKKTKEEWKGRQTKEKAEAKEDEHGQFDFVYSSAVTEGPCGA